jgi:hypothetical protein
MNLMQQRISDEEFERLAASIPDREPPVATKRFRKGSLDAAALDHLDHLNQRGLTGRQRARIVQRAEDIERSTRQSGRRNGALGRPAVDILRAMVLKFGRSGKCFPSYEAIRQYTGYCNETIRRALKALENAGLIARIRRRATKVISRISQITGRREDVAMEVQTSNLYTFRADRPAPGLELMAKPDTKRREFPQKRSLLDWLGDFDTTALETPDNEGSFLMLGSDATR